MENEDEIRKIIEKSKKINEEQGQKNPVGRPKKQPAPAPAPTLAPAPAPASDKLEISKDDYDMLISLAKKENQPPVQADKIIEQPEPLNPAEFVSDVVENDTGYSDIMANPMILYFDTDRTCSVINGKINEDGSLKIGERIFDFVEGNPAILKLGGKGKKKTHPFYIVKYNNMKPIDMTEYPNSIPSPEETTRLVDLKTLETLSRIAGGKIGKVPLIMLLLVGLLIGGVTVFMLFMTGVLGG